MLLFLRIASKRGRTIGKLILYCPGPIALREERSGKSLDILERKTEEGCPRREGL